MELHSLLLALTLVLNLSLCLLFLFLKLNKNKQKQENPTKSSNPPCLNPYSAPTDPKEKEPTTEKEQEPTTEQEKEKEKEDPQPKEGEEKKRRKRARKKKQEGDLKDDKVGTGTGKNSPFPFSSFESAMQRRIQLKYDELVRSNEKNRLTSAQVSDFIDCLVEARNELQHKSELIQRSFKIKKALLSKADRSSFDRLYNQVFKLEFEHKKLQQDAAVYNVLQEQLKLSPAYKTLLEIGDKMKPKENEEQMADFADISFEELLAQEKKDSFWQKNGKMRTFAN